MKSSLAKYWGAVKFGIVLGLKSWPRITVSPFVGAFRGLVKEAERVQAEIDAYNARDFGGASCSTGAGGRESKSEVHQLAR